VKLLFEHSKSQITQVLPPCDIPQQEVAPLPAELGRKLPPRLPQMSESEVARHYTALARQVFGVGSGFYPLGSCTMKYNPKLNEQVAALPGFTGIHPLQPEETVQGCLEVLALAERYLCEITGMDAMSFQPAAGAHGEYAGLLLIRAYHHSRGDTRRTNIIVPDSAHGTNPASAVMAGFRVINVASGPDGCVDLEKLRAVCDENTAGLMLTNPNTLGLFEKDMTAIADIVHKAGGLVYYDGANLNPIMGIIRPGDMGFDVIHLNLHKTFSTPHGGGGPGSGPVGCKEFLAPFLPRPHPVLWEGALTLEEDRPQSVGKVRSFYGNFLVVVKTLAYILRLGAQGIPQAAKHAVLNANYLKQGLAKDYDLAVDLPCMHEFVLGLSCLKKETGVSAMDVAKAMLDYGMHPPTMYFPLIVPEALMFEPTETETKETLDETIKVLSAIYQKALEDPQALREAPHHTAVRRPDEVQAARQPVLRYRWED
jgi:glycine dehydrogenase subunit 2